MGLQLQFLKRLFFYVLKGFLKNHSYDVITMFLNQAVIAKNIIGREQSCAKSVLEYAATHGFTYNSINQGYAKEEIQEIKKIVKEVYEPLE